MPTCRSPFGSLSATGVFSKSLAFRHTKRGTVVLRRPKVPAVTSAAQATIRNRNRTIMQHWPAVAPADQATWDHFALPAHTSRIDEYYRYNFFRVAAGLPIADLYPPPPMIPFLPALRYALNDNADTTNIVDDSGYAQHGTASRKTYLDSVPGKLGTAWNTNAGVNTITSPIAARNAGTLCLWFYINSLVAAVRTFMGRQDATGRCSLMKTNAHKLAGAIGSQSYPTIFGGDPLVAATWYHAALSWSAADGVRLYCNAQQIYAGAMAGNLPTNVLLLGNFPDYFTGVNARLDDARVYTQVLTPYQIAAIWNNGNGTPNLQP